MSTMLIEDIMPLVTNQDDYLKYYMDESLPLFDKINIIIKKGESMQRQALINNLNSFVHDSLFSNLIQFIISDIGTWEAETINIFPKSLYNIIINNKLDNELFNIIFKHIIINITTGADETKTEYNIYFDKIIEYYRPTKTSYEIYNNININIDKEFPYKLNNNIFEFILSLGKFGQSPINRRLCCYLCSSLCRLLLNKDNDKNITTDENIFKMYQRLGFLFEDPEKIIEVQMVRELQYIIPLFKSIMFNNKDIIKSIECYIKLNFENLAQSMCIICLLNNIIIIKDQEDLCNLLIKQIKEIIEDDKDYEINFKNDIMECLINCLYNNYKFISDIVKQVFDLGIIEYYINNLYSIETLNIYLKNFDKIYFLKNNLDETDSDNNSECNNNNTCNTNSINLINICINNSNTNTNTNINNICQTFTQSIEIKNQSKIIFEELFINIYNKLYNKVESTESSSNNLINITKNDLKDLSEENKKLLFKYLSNILKCIFSYNKFNKQISDILFDLLKKESIINILTYYCKEENENEKYYIKKKNKLYKLLHFFVKNNHRKYINNINNNNNNNINSYKEFILDNNNIYNKLLILILNNIFSIIEELQKPCNSDQCLLVSNTLYQLIPKLYKYYKNIVIIVHNNNNMNYIITNNQVKENNNDNRIYYLEKLYEDIFNKILSIIILNQKIGFYIKNEYIKIIPLLILYSSNRNKYLQFIRKHILNSDNFFLRKFSLTFIEACLSHYSFNFIKKTNIYDDIIILMKDNVNIISTGTINIIYKYIKKIIRYSHGVFQELCEEIKDIYNINIQKFNHDIKNFDKEKNIIINKILNINDSNELEEFFNKDDIIKIKEIENKFIILENDIFNFELNFHKIKNQKKNGGGDIENNKNNHEITRSIFQRVSSTSTSFQALTGLTNHIPFNQRLNTKKNSLTDKSSNILKSLTSKNISNKLYLPKIKAKRKDSNCSNGNNNNNINSNIYVIKPKISEKDIIMAKNKKLLPFSKNRTPSAKTLKKNNNNSPINNNNSNINTNNNCEEFNFKARSNKKSISNKNINFFVKPNIKGNIQGNNKIYINAAEKINTSVTSSK